MYERPEDGSNIIEVARRCLGADAESCEALLVYQFESEVDAHNEALQVNLETEFKDAWLRATSELETEFGPATVEEDAEETDWVPLCGVGGVSSWRIDQRVLWLAYAHEDRETPYLLIIGREA